MLVQYCTVRYSSLLASILQYCTTASNSAVTGRVLIVLSTVPVYCTVRVLYITGTGAQSVNRQVSSVPAPFEVLVTTKGPGHWPYLVVSTVICHTVQYCVHRMSRESDLSLQLFFGQFLRLANLMFVIYI